jgi:hypothetical protein
MEPENFVDIFKCARCGGDHLNLRRVRFLQFHEKSMMFYTHFAICPATNQPILIFYSDQ